MINQDENNNFFEFINQRSLNILDYIFFYINKENIKITNTSKKTKDNKENNEINVDINEKAQKAKKNDINKNKSKQNKSKSLNDTKTESEKDSSSANSNLFSSFSLENKSSYDIKEISKEKIKKDLVGNSKKNSKSNQSNISIIKKK